MKFKTGILIDSLQIAFEDALKISSDSGADGIQLYAASHHMASLELDYKAAKSELLKKFIEETGEKNLKVNFDPANLVMVQGENPAEAVLNLKDYIVYTHAKDGRMVRECNPVLIYNAFAQGNPDNINIDDYFIELPLGSGDVNFPEYLKALEDIGYSGYLTIEREAGSDRMKDITEGVYFLKGVIK